MISYFDKRHNSLLYKFLSAFIAFTFGFTSILPPAYAQSIASLNLPVPGAMVMPTPAFVPVLLKGMTIHPDNPLQFDFIIDSGNTDFKEDRIKEESQRLVKYFLASMTIPKDDLWVNLSPYESDRIIPDELGKTELGRDMLAQDYILKQLTASLMYPEKELGKEFWDKVYKLAKEKYGTTEIPVNTFNKVWILPETATVYEHGQTVYIVEAKLKVMLEHDYKVLQQSRAEAPAVLFPEGKQQGLDSDYLAQSHQKAVTGDVVTGDVVTTEIVKEIILPAIEKEVNEGQNFAPLRQIYHSLILAKWYKETIKNSLLSKVYVDKKLINGIRLEDGQLKGEDGSIIDSQSSIVDQIYDQYMEAYKKGVFNYIKEDYDRLSNETIPRKYFSGGIKGDVEIGRTDSRRGIEGSAVGENYQLAMEVSPQKDGAAIPKKSSSPVSVGDLEEMLKGKGVLTPKVNEFFLEIYNGVIRINPDVDLPALYYLYRHNDVQSHLNEIQLGLGTVTVREGYTDDHSRYGGDDYDRVINNSSFINFLREEMKIPDVYLREIAYTEGLRPESPGDYALNPEHYYTQYRNEYYVVPNGYASLVGFLLLAKDLPIRKVLLGKTDEYWNMVEAGVRLLGKDRGEGEIGNKESGFLVFDRLGLRYPPGIVLSEKLVEAILQMSDKEQETVISYFLEKLSQTGIAVGKEKLAVRSNPKQSMPGILVTATDVGSRAEELRKAITYVAKSWYTDRATRYRARLGLGDTYDLPIIIQAWKSGKSPDDQYLENREKDPFTPLFASGVFSTRDPNTGKKVLYGRYVLNEYGESLMRNSSVGEDINKLERLRPFPMFNNTYRNTPSDIYKRLRNAAYELENAIGPQEIEFVVHDGMIYFLQTRQINFAPQAEIAYINELGKTGKITMARAMPLIENLQKEVATRKSYKIKEGADLKVIANATDSTPGAFQGSLAWSEAKIQQLMDEGKRIVFVTNGDSSDNLWDKVFNYPQTGLISIHGNGSSHNAVLTRLAGIVSLINFQGHVKFDPDSEEGIFFENGRVLEEGVQVLLDGDRGVLHEAPSENVLEESHSIFDASYGIDIPLMRKIFLAPYLDENGSIKPEFTVQRLEELDQAAAARFDQLARQDKRAIFVLKSEEEHWWPEWEAARFEQLAWQDKKAIFIANLEKHFIHDLLSQRLQELKKETEQGSDSSAQSSSPVAPQGSELTSDEIRATSDEVGGIDMNAIDLDRQGAGVDIQFDPAELQEIIDLGIDGFAPVIINITPLPSILPLLGLDPVNKEEEVLELSAWN